MSISNYERQQIQEVRNWQEEKPSVVLKWTCKFISPLDWLISKTIKEAAMRGALDISSYAAKYFTDTNDITIGSGLSSIKA